MNTMAADAHLADRIATARAHSLAFFQDWADGYRAAHGPGMHRFFLEVTLLGAVAELAKHCGAEVAAQWIAVAAQDIGVSLGPPQRRPAFLRGFICGAIVAAAVVAILVGGLVVSDVF